MACTEEENARKLQAWNAWKEVCWVHGVGKQRGDLPIVGTEEDEAILSKMIGNAFRRKLWPYMVHFQNEQGRDSLADIDFAQEFDDALTAYRLSETPGHERYDRGHYGEPNHVRKAKAWKDFVWDAIAASDDPPLKVIIGKLLSKDGVINDVVKDWLLANYACRFEGKMLVFHKSRDAEAHEATNDAGVEGFEQIAMEAISPVEMVEDSTEAESQVAVDEAIEVPLSWREELENAFSPKICCLMFAHIKGVKIYADREILSALGIGKTTAAAELKKLEANSEAVLGKLSQGLREWLLVDAAGTKYFLNWIENRCRAEKAGQLILSRVAMTKVVE